MRVLLVTVARHPLDARAVQHAQALHAAGHCVDWAAPFREFDVSAPPWARAHDLPFSHRTPQLRPLRLARATVWALRRDVDLVLLLDSELVLAVAGRVAKLPPVVVDVGPDLASPDRRARVPALLRPLAEPAGMWLDRAAQARVHLVLSDPGQARRFSGTHPVVPNHLVLPEHVPPPGAERVVYIGEISDPRGAADLIETGRRLKLHGIRTELLGSPDHRTSRMLEIAAERGTVAWTPAAAHDLPAASIQGALAGLSLRRDTWEYRLTVPAEVQLYLAHGLPIVMTALPRAAEIVRRHRCGVVLPFGRPESVVRAVLAIRDDPQWRQDMGGRAHRAARRELNGQLQSVALVTQLESWADGHRVGTSRPAQGDISSRR